MVSGSEEEEMQELLNEIDKVAEFIIEFRSARDICDKDVQSPCETPYALESPPSEFSIIALTYLPSLLCEGLFL